MQWTKCPCLTFLAYGGLGPISLNRVFGCYFRWCRASCLAADPEGPRSPRGRCHLCQPCMNVSDGLSNLQQHQNPSLRWLNQALGLQSLSQALGHLTHEWTACGLWNFFLSPTSCPVCSTDSFTWVRHLRAPFVVIIEKWALLEHELSSLILDKRDLLPNV